MNTWRPILILIVTLLIGYHAANAQSKPVEIDGIKCDHTSTQMDRFRGEHRDGYFPFIARNYDGSHIEWTISDNKGSYVGTLNVDRDTKLPLGFSEHYKGQLFWAIYSPCDDYAYAIYSMSDAQEKQFRKDNPK